VPKIKAHTPQYTSERRATIQDNVQLPRVYMGWLTSPIFKPVMRKKISPQRFLGVEVQPAVKKLVYETDRAGRRG